MSDTVIKAENISKQYRLGNVGLGTLSHDLNRWWYNVRGKEDPYLKIGEENNRAQKAESEYVWALRDINFEVKQGEVLGIIGRNGAGKSTLLKILSRTTTPTTGQIKIKGRVASLLEVGTGFHPELTGRENIFLNGAILGMTKSEIKSKFDEIVDFAGVERYIDTPVKRYSSGMYVRLAFGVAAHLEPEILIVDEVLAVGDAEFQKKALGKMKDISQGQGRTVLFVSHNMAAVQNLCETGILLASGKLEGIGKADEIVNKYLAGKKNNTILLSEINERSGNGSVKFLEGAVKTVGSDDINVVESFTDILIELKVEVKDLISVKNASVDIRINNVFGDGIAWLSTDTLGVNLNLAEGRVCFKIKNLPLAPGDYSCNLFCKVNGDIADWMIDVMPFSVIDKDYFGTGKVIPARNWNILLNYQVTS